MSERIPFVYIRPSLAKKLSFTKGLAQKPGAFFQSLSSDLKATNLDLKKEDFLNIVFLNALMWLILSAVFLFSLMMALEARSFVESLYFSVGLGALLFFMIYLVTVRYPAIQAGKKAEEIDKNLVFALKDMLLQITAGIPLYDSFVKVANSGYGEVSKEFEKTARDIQVGVPMDKALEKMALRSNSEFMKRTVWQIVNVLKSGSNLQQSLRVVITDLVQSHREKIRVYAQELNMWSLIYMLFAVAIPTIGSTVMLIMTSFSGASVTQSSFIVFGVLCLCVQYVIIGLIQSRRPVINI